jgi:hypothetical protein
MTNKKEIDAFAQKYNLFQGKHADFYDLHGRWALTKQGAETVALAEKITFSFPVATVFDCGIAYAAEFKSETLWRTVSVVGSCRWDQAKPPSPESTHAPEMAWKRMFVRGVIALAAPSLLHGEDEFTSEFKNQGGGQQPQAAPQGFPQAPPQAPPQAAPRSNGVASHGEAVDAPSAAMQQHAQRMQGVQGWFNGAEKLPHEWGELMGRFCELTGLERSQWEMVLVDHGGKFQKDNGEWWKPSQTVNSFNALAMGTKEWNGTVSSKAKQALIIKKAVGDLIDELDATGGAEIVIPNPEDPRTLVKRMVQKRDGNREPVSSQPTHAAEFAPDFPAKSDFPDDVPF